MTRITRRGVLIGSGTVVAVVTAGMGVSYAFSGAEDAVLAVLHRRLGPLKIAAADLVAFSQDYLKSRAGYASQLRWLGSVALVYRHVTPYDALPMGAGLRRLEDNIVSSFLLSTDFFEHGADVSRPLHYAGLHDPYRRPCRRIFQN
jgi:hypothetical protein